MLIELFYIGFPFGADGRSDGRTVSLLPKFMGWMDHQIFLGMGLRSRAREAPLKNYKTVSPQK